MVNYWNWFKSAYNIIFVTFHKKTKNQKVIYILIPDNKVAKKEDKDSLIKF